MSGVLEEILATLKRIEANTAGGVKTDTPSPGTDAPTTPPVKPRGRPVGSTKKVEEKPVVQPAADVGDDSSFLDDEPEAEAKPPTKDEVRKALVAYNKQVNSEQKTRDLLKTAGGVDNLSALKEDSYAAVVKAVLAAGVTIPA